VAGASVSTINRHVAGIRHAHRLKGFESPTASEPVRQTRPGSAAPRGTAPERKVPATAERVLVMAEGLPTDTVQGLRDRALLERAGIEEGPVFRPVGKAGHVRASRLATRSVGSVVKRAAERGGLDPAQFSGHGPDVRPQSQAKARAAPAPRLRPLPLPALTAVHTCQCSP